MGVMAGIMAAAIDVSGTIMIDATYLKAHRTASNSRFIKSGRLIGRTKGRLNTKLHAVTDTESTFSSSFSVQANLAATPARLPGSISQPKADWLLADKGHDASRFREALLEQTGASSSALWDPNPTTQSSSTTSAATAPRSCSAAGRRVTMRLAIAARGASVDPELCSDMILVS